MSLMAEERRNNVASIPKRRCLEDGVTALDDRSRLWVARRCVAGCSTARMERARSWQQSVPSGL